MFPLCTASISATASTAFRALPTRRRLLSGLAGLATLIVGSAGLLAADTPLPDDPLAPKVKKGDKPNPPAALAPIEDQPGLPRVLLIGDSISIGYTLPVRRLLEGKANLHRIPQNGGPTKNGVARMKTWLGTGKWDVIHFNWGIHDLKHMPDGQRQVEPAAYEANLRQLVTQMKATGAKLIWATTTPIPDGPLQPPRTFGSVPEYNAIAARVMKEHDVAVDDLYTWILSHVATLQIPRDVHFTPQGSAKLAEAVAASIAQALPQSSQPSGR